MARMRYGSGKVFVIRHQDFILASIKEGKTLAMIHEEKLPQQRKVSLIMRWSIISIKYC